MFTELITKIGVKGVQMSEVWDLDSSLDPNLGKVYGFIFLFKWQRDIVQQGTVDVDAPGVFFAKQVINNAGATQAIISVLLNIQDDVELGEELANLKGFAGALPVDVRGELIGSSDNIRIAHNSFARPEPFVTEEEPQAATDDDDVYHFVGYVPANGGLYELDGLKEGPVRVSDCPEEEWLAKAREAIGERMRAYSSKEVRFALMAVTEDRLTVIPRRQAETQARLDRVRAKLTGDASAGDDLPSDESELQALQAEAEQQLRSLEEALEDEQQVRARWAAENVRRKHNYVPFIFNVLKRVAEKSKLKGLVTAGKAAAERRREERAKAKAKSETKKEAE